MWPKPEAENSASAAGAGERRTRPSLPLAAAVHDAATAHDAAPASDDLLPAPLRLWALTRWRGERGAPAAEAFEQRAAAGRVVVRWLADRAAGDSVVLLFDEQAVHSPEPLRALGLTAREAEVLYWLTEGKSYKDIAVILACESRTAQKHAERTFAKLGVDGRHAAAVRAREVLG